MAKTIATEMNQNLQLLIRTPFTRDIGALARIHLAAFRNDRLVRLMHSEANHWKAVEAMIEKRMSHDNGAFRIATTKTGDRIVGWLCWSLVDPIMPAQDDLASREWTTAAICAVEDAEKRLTDTSGRPTDVAECERRRSIWKIISDASSAAFSTYPDTVTQMSYIVVNTLVTDFAFEARGVGFELLTWATKYADTKEIAIRAQVSPRAYGLFRKAGFEEVYSPVLDLDGIYYAGVAKDHRGKSKWGNHEVNFMVRKARNRSEVDQTSQQLRSLLPRIFPTDKAYTLTGIRST